MKYPKAFCSLLTPIAVLVFLFNGCTTELEPLLPADQDPAITILEPASNNFLLEAGDEFTVTFRMADAEALKVFRAIGTIYDQDDQVVGNDVILFEDDLSGVNLSYDYVDDVPAVTPYFKIRYTCYAVDSKGAYASAVFWVSVLPAPSDPSPFEVLSYEKDSIFNRKSNAQYGFNFTQRRQLPAVAGQTPNLLDLDIAENSNTGQGIWSPTLNSPSNDLLGRDSVFVITDASHFNYEEATYQTIYEAFYSDPAPYSKTPVLKVDDYVIVRLTKSPFPQFAVMHITKVKDDGAGVNIRDYVVFNYKVTSQ
ncbi:MAG: hypothetical protein SF052_15275 [Bacteroidia bacterium]|nr:hypothetical protein [Bacteroidia bacterium]